MKISQEVGKWATPKGKKGLNMSHILVWYKMLWI